MDPSVIQNPNTHSPNVSLTLPFPSSIHLAPRQGNRYRSLFFIPPPKLLEGSEHYGADQVNPEDDPKDNDRKQGKAEANPGHGAIAYVTAKEESEPSKEDAEQEDGPGDLPQIFDGITS